MRDPLRDSASSFTEPSLPDWAVTALRTPVHSTSAARAAIMEAVRTEPAPRRSLSRFVRRLPSLTVSRWPRRGLLTPFAATAIAATFAGMLSLQSLRASIGTRLGGMSDSVSVLHASAMALGDTVVPMAAPIGGAIRTLASGNSRFMDTLRIVEFVLRGANVHSAQVVGDFNAWRRGATPLVRGDDGRWRARVVVPREMVHFTYVVNDDLRGSDHALPRQRPTLTSSARFRVDSI